MKTFQKNIKPSFPVTAMCAAVMFFSGILFADEIHMKSGGTIKGKIILVTPERIEYRPEDGKPFRIIHRQDAVKITFDDGRVAHLAVEENLHEKKGTDSVFRVVRDDKMEPLLLPLPLKLTALTSFGDTKIWIYDRSDKRVADGKAKMTQFFAYLNYEPVKTNFYITPELGYFYRMIKVGDYSYNIEGANTQNPGYIPGVITDSGGSPINKASVYSLKYNAEFHSIFLSVKAGAHLVYGSGSVQFLLNPYISLSLLELRKSSFEFSELPGGDKFSMPFKFQYVKNDRVSWGYGAETGIYFPGLRSGLKIGGEKSYLSRFELPSQVRFKEVYFDTATSLYRTREKSVQSSKIEATLLTITVFYFI
jgi:hypothetical protein